MEDYKVGDASFHSFALLATGGSNIFTNSEKAKALADSLETQFQPVNDPSDPAVTDLVNEAMRLRVCLRK
jgi:archaellum component FlaG (FlaF/FlaG flagellin family)